MATYLYAKSFYFEDQVAGPGYLEILADGSFGTYQSQEPDQPYDLIDYGNYQIAPGLVDTHIHGYGGADVMDNDLEAIKTISAGLPGCGVTSYLPTTLTASHDLLDQVCATIGDNWQAIPGAKIQGIFLEGPFFSEAHKGAQNPKYMSDPSIQALDKWQGQAKGLVKKIAIAPERKGSVDFIHHAKDKGIYVALAHTEATYQDCKEAVEAGANIFVHTYNGMRGLHHREPGVVGAALTLPNVFAELICDGHHVHPAAAQVVVKCRGCQETALITDCMRAGGLGDTDSMLGEFEVEVRNGAARLKEGGSLAGSVLELIQGVQNMVKWGLASPHQAITMASLTPAKSVGIDDKCGKIAPGYPADWIVLDDQLQLQATYINGQLAYQK